MTGEGGDEQNADLINLIDNKADVRPVIKHFAKSETGILQPHLKGNLKKTLLAPTGAKGRQIFVCLVQVCLKQVKDSLCLCVISVLFEMLAKL